MSTARTAHVLDEAELSALSSRSSGQRAAVLLAIDHLDALPAAPRAALLAEARGWLTDCGTQDAGDDAGDAGDVGDVGDVEDALVRELVHRQYDGGWSAFVVAHVDLLEAGAVP